MAPEVGVRVTDYGDLALEAVQDFFAPRAIAGLFQFEGAAITVGPGLVGKAPATVIRNAMDPRTCGRHPLLRARFSALGLDPILPS